MHGGDERKEGTEHLCIEAHFAELTRIAHAHLTDAADVVIHDPDFHAFLHFTLQNFQNGVQEAPLFNDEIFQKDKLFGFFQFPHHGGKHILAHGEILRMRSVIHGTAAAFINIFRLRRRDGVLFFQCRQSLFILTNDTAGFPFKTHIFPFHAAAGLIAAEKDEQHAAEDRRNDNHQ